MGEGFRLNATCFRMNLLGKGMNEMGIGSVSCATVARAEAHGNGTPVEGMDLVPLRMPQRSDSRHPQRGHYDPLVGMARYTGHGLGGRP